MTMVFRLTMMTIVVNVNKNDNKDANSSFGEKISDYLIF